MDNSSRCRHCGMMICLLPRKGWVTASGADPKCCNQVDAHEPEPISGAASTGEPSPYLPGDVRFIDYGGVGGAARPSELSAHKVEPQWNPISTAPKNAKEVRVQMKDGSINERAHWASDLSGSDQPPFQGWFISYGDGFAEIDEPKFWQEIRPEPVAGTASAPQLTPLQEKLCGIAANAPTSMNAAIHPTAKDVEPLQVHHLPQEEWKKLSPESRESISKWFDLATKYLQSILDESSLESAAREIAEMMCRPPTKKDEDLWANYEGHVAHLTLEFERILERHLHSAAQPGAK